MLVYKVLLDLEANEVDNYYSYLNSNNLDIKIGTRILVPFGNLIRLGIVFDIVEEDISNANYIFKDIIDVFDDEKILSDEFFIYYDYFNKYTKNLKISIVKNILEIGNFLKYEKKVTLLSLDYKLPDDLKINFEKNNVWILKNNDLKYYSKLKKLEKDNILKIETIHKQKGKNKTINIYYYNFENNYKNISKYEVLFNIYKEKSIYYTDKQLEEYGFSKSNINTLIKNNCLIKDKINILDVNIDFSFDNITYDLSKNENDFISNIKKNENYLVVDDVINNQNYDFYFKLIENNLKNNQSVLICFPEQIKLDYFYDLLVSRYSDQLVLKYSSKETISNRLSVIETLKNNTPKIILGTTKALFLDFNNLGLILYMFSNSNSYYRQEKVIFNPLDIAKIKNNYYKSTLILVTNFCKVSNYYLTKKENIFERIPLFHNGKDINFLETKTDINILPKEVLKDIEKSVENNQNVILYLNKKGFSRNLRCNSCLKFIKCEKCNKTLTMFYTENNKFYGYCSNCNIQNNYYYKCPYCKKEKSIYQIGNAQEKLFLELLSNLSKYKDKIKIINKDLFTKKEILNLIEENKSNILISTNYLFSIPKINNCGLICYLDSNQVLNLPVYNHNEVFLIDLYNLMYYKNENTKFYVLTYDNNNLVYSSLKNSDYLKYYNQEILDYNILNKYPFANNKIIIFSGDSLFETYKKSLSIINYFKSKGLNFIGLNEVFSKDNELKHKYSFKTNFSYQKLEELKFILDYLKENENNSFHIKYDAEEK